MYESTKRDIRVNLSLITLLLSLTQNQTLELTYNLQFPGLLSIVTVMPLVRSEGKEDSSFEDLFFNDKETGFRYRAFNNEQYKLGLKHILPYYEALGVLE